jgi:Na+/proline symporter
MVTPVLIFLLVSFLIGIHASSRIGGKVRNYYVAGNIIPFWVLALSMTGQAIELGGTQDNATFAMTDGFWAGAVLPVGIGLSLILIGLFYAEPLHRMRLLTLPDFYYQRFDRRVELLVSILCVVSFMILIAGNLAGVGIILHFTLDIPPLAGIALVSLPVMLYTMAGGLFAVTWNDVLHAGVIILGFSAALIWIFISFDQQQLLSALDHGVRWESVTDFKKGALSFWASLLALALGDIVAIDFMERVFAAKSPRYAKLSCILSGIITIVIGAALAVIGILAAEIAPPGGGEDIFLQFVTGTFPAGIAMMVLMALLAACISTIDGAIMASSVVITKNIVQQNFPSLIPRDRLLLFSRLACIPVTVGSIVIAIIRPVPGDLLILAFDVVFAGCLVPLTLGIYWKRATAQAAFWAVVIPSALRVALYIVASQGGIPEHLAGIETLIPPLLSLLLMVGISLHAEKRTTEVCANV